MQIKLSFCHLAIATKRQRLAAGDTIYELTVVPVVPVSFSILSLQNFSSDFLNISLQYYLIQNIDSETIVDQKKSVQRPIRNLTHIMSTYSLTDIGPYQG